MALGNLAALGAGFGAGMDAISQQNRDFLQMQLQRAYLQNYQRAVADQLATQRLYDQIASGPGGIAGLFGSSVPQQAPPSTPSSAPVPGGGLAPGFQRDPSGMLTRGGQQPDTMLPGGVPAWKEGSLSSLPGGFGQAIQQAESGGSTDPYLTSKAGAIGPRQMMPATFAENAPPGANIYDPQQNIAASDRYIGKLSQEFKGDPNLVAAAYNAGPRRVADSLKTGMPLPAETIKFVRNVTSHLPWPVQSTLRPVVASMPPEEQHAATTMASAVGKELDPAQWGVAQMRDLADRIDKAAPDAPGHVKIAALAELSKLMAPDQKMLMSMLLLGQRQNFAAMQQQGRQQFQQEQQARSQGFQEKKQSGEIGMPLPLQYPDKWEGMPNTPPPGVREDVWDTTLYFARTHQMPAIGFQPGMRTQVIQAYPAALHALGIMPASAPDVAAAYAGERHGEIVGGGRAAQIGLGLREAEQLGPTVKEAAKGIPATEFPSENKFLNWLNTQTGDPNIVRFRGALNSFLQTYTRTVGGTMSLTDFRLQHAYTLINDAMARGQINQAIDQLVYEMQVMGAAVPEAMRDLQQIGQPPATRAPANVPAMPGSQGGPIKLDANGNEIK